MRLTTFLFALSTPLVSLASSPRRGVSAVAISGKVPRRASKFDALSKQCNGLAALAGANLDSEYLVNVTIGGQTFKLIVDSGSSDTWVPDTDFTCINATGSRQPQSACDLGSPGFDPGASKTFEALEGFSFAQSYGTGEIVLGSMGQDTVSVGGIEVSKQTIGVPTTAYIIGDGEKSGIFGLAFPEETSMFNVSDPTKASNASHVPYDPFFFTAVKEKKVDAPYFSIALNRGSYADKLNSTYVPDLGYLALGGHAPVSVFENTSTTVPVQPYTYLNETNYYWYPVAIDSYNFPDSESIPTAANGSLTPGVTILDSGTGINILPDAVVAGYATAFNPPATYANVSGLAGYVVDCNATVPEFSVTIGGTNFSMDARDLVFPVATDASGDVVCVLGTQSTRGPGIPSDLFILGDTFLYNVVATFNPIEKEVTLIQRTPY